MKQLLNWKVSVDHTKFTQVQGHKSYQYYCKLWGNETQGFLFVCLSHLGEYHQKFLNEFFKPNIDDKLFTAICLDYAGHGLSTGTRGDFTDFEDYQQALFDVLNKYSDRKIILFGHGLGAMLALSFNQRFSHHLQNIHGVILLDAFSNYGQLINPWQKYFNKSLQKLSPKMKYYPLNFWLNNFKKTDEFDPFCNPQVSMNAVHMALNLKNKMVQDAYFIQCPILHLMSYECQDYDYKMHEIFKKSLKSDRLKEVQLGLSNREKYNIEHVLEIRNIMFNWINQCTK